MSIEGLVPVFVNAVLKPEAYISALLPSTVSSGIVISILACGQFLEKKNLATRHLLTVVMLGVCAGVCLLTLALVAFISSSEVCTELAASASGGGGTEVVAADEGYNSCAANSSAAGGVGVEMVCVNPWHGSMAMVGVLGVLLLVYGACIGYAVYVPPCVFVAQFGGANSGTMMVSATALSRAAFSERNIGRRCCSQAIYEVSAAICGLAYVGLMQTIRDAWGWTGVRDRLRARSLARLCFQHLGAVHRGLGAAACDRLSGHRVDLDVCVDGFERLGRVPRRAV